jgi:hypothetical protein
LNKARDLLQKLVEQDPSNRAWQRDLYIAELRLFDLAANNADKSSAAAQLRKLHDGLAELIRLDPKKLNLQIVAAGVQQRQAAVELKNGQQANAAATLAPALQQLQKLHDSAPADQLALRYLLDALILDADISLAGHDASTARNRCEAAESLLKPLVQGSKDMHLLSPWAKVQLCLNQQEPFAAVKKTLENMNYRDPFYLQYLSNHSSKKASI